MRLIIVASALAAFFLLAGGGNTAGADEQVAVGNVYFCTQEFEGSVCETPVEAGETVTWSVVAGFHTVTQCDSAFEDCPPAGGIDSGSLNQGDTFSQTFASPGSVYYYCAFHPNSMRGRIEVQAAPTATAAPTQPPATDGAATATTPAAAPRTGGAPGDEGEAILSYALMVVGLALLSTSGLVFALSRARR